MALHLAPDRDPVFPLSPRGKARRAEAKGDVDQPTEVLSWLSDVADAVGAASNRTAIS